MAQRSNSFVPADRYLYKAVRAGEPKVTESSTSSENHWFFNPKVFTLLVCVASIFFAASMTYLGAVLGTIEKRFQLKSTESGMFFTVNDVIGLCTVLIITHIGHKTSKPKMIGSLYVLFSIACFMHVLPHVFYDTPSALTLTEVYNTSDNMKALVCDGSLNQKKAACSKQDRLESGSLMRQAWWIILAQAVIGLSSAITPLTVTFIDDNQKKKNTPVYIAIVFSCYTIGVVVGFFLGTFCLSLPVNYPNVNPETDVLNPRDPRFIGAWWLGFIVCGICTLLAGSPLLLFPASLSGKHGDDLKRNQSYPKEGALKEFLQSLRRVVTNMPAMFLILSSCMSICSFVGLRTFGAKYVYTQFDMKPAEAAMIVGIIIIPCAVFGNLTSGFLVRKLKLTIRGMATMMTGLLIITMLIIPGFYFVGCPQANISGLTVQYSETLTSLPDVTAVCNGNCSCPSTYRPVCGSDGITYVSACHAGCEEEVITEADTINKTVYGSCSCVSSSDSEDAYASMGACPRNCNVIPHLVLALFSSAVGSFIINPSIMLKLRLVEDRDKPLTLGITNSLLKVFAYIPGPIYWGAIVDSTCLLYQESCGKTGNCIIYDTDKFRVNFYSFSLAVKIVEISCVSVVLGTLISRGRQGYTKQENKPDHIYRGSADIIKSTHTKV